MQGPVTVAAFLSIVLLAACQSGHLRGPLSLQVEARDAVVALQRVNKAGMQCWVRSSDPAFSNLHLVPELDTSAGRPRLLLLEKGKAEGLPVLVIEASGEPVTIQTYGPLAGTRTAGRVNADIVRWSSGSDACEG